MRNKLFAIMDVLAAAVAAFEAVGDRVIRYNEAPDSKFGINGNKEMVQQWLGGNQENLVVTESHREHAEEMRTFLSQQLTLSILTNTPLSGFYEDIVRLLSEEQISLNKVGLLVWAPSLYKSQVHRQQSKTEIQESCAGSKFVGQQGKSIELSVSIKEKHFLKDYSKYRVTCSDSDGNLIQFYINKIADMPDLKIKGRVKNHRYNTHCGNLATTYLNYVKIL
jgi:hypothetical protein